MSRNYFAFSHFYIWTNTFLLQPCIAIRHSPPRTTGKTCPNIWTSISQKEVNIPDSLFLATAPEINFDIPKLHSLLHFSQSIQLFGATDNYNTKQFKQLYLNFVKDAFCALNKQDEHLQMIKWVK